KHAANPDFGTTPITPKDNSAGCESGSTMGLLPACVRAAFMASKRATKTDAVLRHIAAGRDISDFPGTKFENGALARSVERRGLTVWDKEGNRYVLTPAGWGALTPRRFGLPSLMVSTAVGATIGAAVLAFLWLPGLQGRDSAYGQATALLAAEKPVVAAAAPPVDASGRSPARVPMAPTSTAPT